MCRSTTVWTSECGVVEYLCAKEVDMLRAVEVTAAGVTCILMLILLVMTALYACQLTTRLALTRLVS